MFQHIKSFVQAGSILIPNWEVTESRTQSQGQNDVTSVDWKWIDQKLWKGGFIVFSIALIHVIVSYVFLVYQMTSTSQYTYIDCPCCIISYKRAEINANQNHILTNVA